jgi:hypothetical protein
MPAGLEARHRLFFRPHLFQRERLGVHEAVFVGDRVDAPGEFTVHQRRDVHHVPFVATGAGSLLQPAGDVIERPAGHNQD